MNTPYSFSFMISKQVNKFKNMPYVILQTYAFSSPAFWLLERLLLKLWIKQNEIMKCFPRLSSRDNQQLIRFWADADKQTLHRFLFLGPYRMLYVSMQLNTNNLLYYLQYRRGMYSLNGFYLAA